MSTKFRATHVKIGDPEWNAARRALEPFVAIYAPGAQVKLDRMADAVVAELRSLPTNSSTPPQETKEQR